MFSNMNKPAFGAATPAPSFGFGGTQAPNAAPFGQTQLFGKPAPATGFGASAPLFGSTPQQTSGALFSTASVPSFGTPPQTSFGTGLFGQQQSATGGNGLFTSAAAPSFGQQPKSAGFGFGASTATPLFGQQPPQNFQPSTSTGVFGGSSGFGGTTQMGTIIKFNPLTGTDTMQKSGITHSISTKHHCITCMKEYEAKSLEELRWEDYQCNRRGPQQQSSFGAPPFGAPAASTAPSLFGQTENKTAFGQTTNFGAPNSGFGLTSQPNQPSLFGKQTSTFGGTAPTSAFGFNATAPTFGGNTNVKPFVAPTQNVFGAPTTQASGFGNTFFGQTNAQPNTGGFFNKPAQPTFNAQQPLFTFGQQTTAPSSLFQPSKPTTGFTSFGQTNLSSNSSFGQQPNIFSQTPQNPFNTFQKPAQPTFGQSLQTGFGIGTQPTANSFFGANKPLFGATNQTNFFTPPSSGFLMTQQQPAPNLSSGFELYQPPDYATTVDQIFDTFPHRDFLEEIAAKSYLLQEATNPLILKEIIDKAGSPVMPSGNINNLRVMSVAKECNSGITKFALLENVIKERHTQSNFLMKASSAKRLVLRNKPTSSSERDQSEDLTKMSPDTSHRQNFIKNTMLDRIASPDSLEVSYQAADNSQENSSWTSIAKDRSLNTRSVRFQNNQNNYGIKESDNSLLTNIDESYEEERLVVDSRSRLCNTDDTDATSGTEDEEAKLNVTSQKSPNSSSPANVSRIKLNRSEYYTVPSHEEMCKYKTESGACLVKGFTVGRMGYGNIYFEEQIDIANLNIDEIVHIRYREIIVYPDDSKKPPVGQGLNRPAQVTLENIWPRNTKTGEVIKILTDSERSNFVDKLIFLSSKQNARFLDYRSDTGSWVFRVDHFSKYHYSDADADEAQKELDKEKLKQELKLKEMEKKQSEAKTSVSEAEDGPSDSTKRGLGGMIQYDLSDASAREVQYRQVLSQGRLSSTFREDTKSRLMKSSFFDEESISDDVSSSDIGVIHHSFIPAATLRASPSRELLFTRKLKLETPRIYKLLNPIPVAPKERSLLVSRNYMDIRLFKGRSFKVGWGHAFTLLSITPPTSGNNPYINTERANSGMPSTILQLKVGSLSNKPKMMRLEEHLQTVFEESVVTVDASKVPLFTIKKNSDALLRHQSISSYLDVENHTFNSYYTQVWDLCVTLWGPQSTTPMERRELFSIWLENSTMPIDEIKLSSAPAAVINDLFVYLTGHRVQRAAQLAMNEGFPRLSALISQSSAHENSKLLINHQIQEWIRSGAINHIGKDMLKVYMLLGGIPVISGVNVCENLDWKQALAIHLWYMCSPGTSLVHALQAYHESFLSFGYACRPTPDYYECTNVMVYDVLYNIMLLFAITTTALENILNPITYTDDPLDYRLSWLLLQGFTALNVGTVSQEVANAVHVNFASQLENLGLWRWSIFALLFMTDASSKTNLIMGILDRNIDVDKLSKNSNWIVEDSLVNDFKIPPKWIHTILANKIDSLQKPIEAYKHLILAENWCKAHEIAISHLIPDFLATGQCEKLTTLLGFLFPGHRHILKWNQQAGLILNFLKLHHQLLVKKQITEFEKKQLKGQLTELCFRVEGFPTSSPKQLQAISEISRFIARLIKIVYCELEVASASNLQAAVELVKLLTMPPDYKLDELAKFVNLYLKLN